MVRTGRDPGLPRVSGDSISGAVVADRARREICVFEVDAPLVPRQIEGQLLLVAVAEGETEFEENCLQQPP